MLVQGPYLVRSAAITANKTLVLTGDIDNSTELVTIIAPSVSSVTWNGKQVAIASRDGNMLTTTLDGPTALTLPSLGPWKWHDSLPEVQTNYSAFSEAWVGKLFITPICRRVLTLY